MRTPRGEGLAILVIDYGPDFDLWWTVNVTKGEHAGEIWTYPNPEVRGVENITMGRRVAPSSKPATVDMPPMNEPTNGHSRLPLLNGNWKKDPEPRG